MCGIAALWGADDRATVARMLRTLSHRGPDGRGMHSHAGPTPATLGHARLAIIDPQGGRQPLLADDGSALVANGMIYNDREVRAALNPAAFRTDSDSESILHLWRERREAAVGALDGMFAFVATDGETMLAARDPIGIKPLYMGRWPGSGSARDRTLVFASEIKAILDVAEDVVAFPPGHFYTPERGLQRYYQVPEPQDGFERPEDAVATLRATLERAVEKRLRSDVPLGCFLSGGLDSSIVAALAVRLRPGLETFAVGTAGSPDLLAARRVAAHLGTEHHELVIGPGDVAEALPAILHHLESYDRDLVRSAVPCWFVAQAAARRVKVVLTGEGADELFAGYAYHHDYDDMALLQRELRRSIEAMGGINLQRVDRMTMAHGLEARVPFLDRAMVDLAMRIPAAWKQRQNGAAKRVEKWILRKAVEDLLPADIVWRVKAQFDEGSGLAELMQTQTDALIARWGPVLPRPGERGTEEALYRSLLAGSAAHPERMLDMVAIWSMGRAA